MKKKDPGEPKGPREQAQKPPSASSQSESPSRRQFIRNASLTVASAPFLSWPIESFAKVQYNIGFWRTQGNGELRVTQAYGSVLAPAPYIPGELRVTQAYTQILASAD